jgi:hypothetical protein
MTKSIQSLPLLSYFNKYKKVVIISLSLLLMLIIGSSTYFAINSQFNEYRKAFAAGIIDSNNNFTRFVHGISSDKTWQNDNIGAPTPTQLIAGPWVGSQWEYWHTDWLQKFDLPNNVGKTPYMYIYQIAGRANKDAAWGLSDCNLGVAPEKTLCKRGADFIRQNRAAIGDEYSKVANKIASIYGTQRPIFIHIEPDFYQYNDPAQFNGGITKEDATKTMNEFADKIKAALPNARLVMDISPWNQDLAGWSAGFASKFDFAGLVGKRFSPEGDGSISAGIDGKTYAQLSAAIGKKIIVNDSHGPGGEFLPYNTNWEDRNFVQARWNDGIVAVLLPPNNQPSLENTINQYFKDPIPKPTVAPQPTNNNNAAGVTQASIQVSKTIIDPNFPVNIDSPVSSATSSVSSISSLSTSTTPPVISSSASTSSQASTTSTTSSISISSSASSVSSNTSSTSSQAQISSSSTTSSLNSSSSSINSSNSSSLANSSISSSAVNSSVVSSTNSSVNSSATSSQQQSSQAPINIVPKEIDNSTIKITDPYTCGSDIKGQVSPVRGLVTVALTRKSDNKIAYVFNPSLNKDGNWSVKTTDIVTGEYINNYSVSFGDKKASGSNEIFIRKSSECNNIPPTELVRTGGNFLASLILISVVAGFLYYFSQYLLKKKPSISSN